MDMRESRDSLSRGLGFASSSELDLPERMRSQRKGALAPPRLSQDPIAFSIADELQPSGGGMAAPKNDSAFARLGRAFRRKSKTGNDIKVDLSAASRDAPPVPKTPRRMPSQALSTKQLDPFAAKALNASSYTADAAYQKSRGSVDVKGKRREVTDDNTEARQRGPSMSIEDVSRPAVAPSFGDSQSVNNPVVAQESTGARAGSTAHEKTIVETLTPGQGSTEHIESSDDALKADSEQQGAHAQSVDTQEMRQVESETRSKERLSTQRRSPQKPVA